MDDFRLPENRMMYFDKLYKMNLDNDVMPGLVYLYMPELARIFKWDNEQKLWFAFLNGMTQNPITSLRLWGMLPNVPPAGSRLMSFEKFFNENWDDLQFDTDRRYQKKDTIAAIKSYAKLVEEHGTQEKMLTGKSYAELWKLVSTGYKSFGRLSSFSYLEYVYLNGFGTDCDDLLFEDKSGSKSHRNGMLLLTGQDHLVWDKRQPNSHSGDYVDLQKMCSWLASEADDFINDFSEANPTVKNVGRFTLESNLCTFKNHFYGRRYPGVYADMAQDRIEWYDSRSLSSFTSIFKKIREDHLPEWLRSECSKDKLNLNQKAAFFTKTGVPYRAEYFI